MKCAKCGHDVDPSSPNCPYCAAGAAADRRQTADAVICPVCGSDRVEESRAWWFDLITGGGGCFFITLHLLLRMWLWILGINPYYYSCLDCGHKWGRRGDRLPIVLLAAAVLLVVAIVGVVILLSVLMRS